MRKKLVVEELFGPGVEILQELGPSVLEVRVQGEERVLKFFDFKGAAEKTRVFQGFVREKGFFTPKIFSLRSAKGTHVLEMEKAPGFSGFGYWKHSGEKKALVLSLASATAKLHLIKPSFSIKRRYWKTGFLGWSDFVASEVKRLSSLAFRKGFIGSVLEKKISSFAGEIVLPEITPCIVHGDFWLDNVFFNEHNKVSSVVDWQASFLGDPCFDVAVAAEHLDLHSSNYSRLFFEGYVSAGGVLGSDFEVCSKVYLAWHFLKIVASADVNGEDPRTIQRLVSRIKGFVGVC